MPNKDRKAKRDRDLDQRPFGDSYFGAPRGNPKVLGRGRRGLPRSPRSPRWDVDRPEPFDPSRRYAWHEGFFEDVELKDGRPTSRTPRRQAQRTTPS